LKYSINIYTNRKIKFFLSELLSDYNLSLFDLDKIPVLQKHIWPSIIILNNKEDFKIINLEKLSGNYLILSNIKNVNFLNKKNNFLQTPLLIRQIKTSIENFVENSKVYFHDILIENEKLTNMKNNSFCYLTKVEVEILSYLISEKETNKDFIKENILNIKNSIQTNSVESHLTRIRKKMNQINTSVKIQTKSDKLLITP
tara:strand:+ start:322 stop:921 length:600 start_codon:yes stop_codon:yes gene_type:complete